MSAPNRTELIVGLKGALPLLYALGSDIRIDSEYRLPYLKQAHVIEQLLLRNDDRPAPGTKAERWRRAR